MLIKTECLLKAASFEDGVGKASVNVRSRSFLRAPSAEGREREGPLWSDSDADLAVKFFARVKGDGGGREEATDDNVRDFLRIIFRALCTV